MNIFVGNLPTTTSEAELQEAFGEYGSVGSIAVVKFRKSGDSRGFGFVQMPDQTEAQDAIGRLDGKPFGGQVLTVRQARSREDRIERAYQQSALTR